MSALAASGSLNGPATYLDWGWVGVSVPNLLVMLLTITVFVLALVLRLPDDGDER